MSQKSDRQDLEAQWWEEVGASLVNLLKHVRSWSQEGNPAMPRAIGLIELRARLEGYLLFNGESYDVDSGFANLVASQARTITTSVYTDHQATEPCGEEVTLGSTRAFDLACRIAAQNERSGAPVPESLRSFAPSSNDQPRRPRRRGDDGEKRVFRNILAWWGVQRGVEHGLRAERNRDVAFTYNRQNGFKSACELVAEAFEKAGWGEVTYNIIVTAWQPHRYGGDLDQRKRVKKSNTIAYQYIFRELDELIETLKPMDD